MILPAAPFSSRRALVFSRLCGTCSVAVLAILVFFTLTGTAETTNTLSDAEIQGRQFVQKILSQLPTENYTNTGTLQMRDGNGRRVEVPVQFEVLAGKSSWEALYSTHITNAINGDTTFGRAYFAQLTVLHSEDQPNVYKIPNINPPPTETNNFIYLTGNQTMIPFAGSDFWCCDLGLEFFHWPEQKVLKKEFHRQCACTVLESTNPNPSAKGYSRVVCWIDNDSFGIVEAFAYDVDGKKLKNFYPKNLEKVNGQYQVESMVMENLQTGSKSVLEFDLNK
jgi:hypothetical protein